MADVQNSNVSRRKALKLIAASTGAATLSSLPGRWTKPNLKVGVLPAHAQISQVPYMILRCAVGSVEGANFISPFDTITTSAWITPAAANIQLRRRITLNEPGHPQNGEVDMATGITDSAGLVSAPDFDLFGITPTISAGTNRVSVSWEFVNPAEGTNTCQNDIEILVPNQG